MAYLTFIIDHYDVLPNVIVFLHPHLKGWPQAWHTDALGYNNVDSVRSLRLGYVVEHGFANMRCLHNPGCPNEMQPWRKLPDRAAEVAYMDTWLHFFGGQKSDVPRKVGTPCCAQFAVSKRQVRERPRADYVKYRKWLLDTELDDNVSGRVFEYMWHIIFGRDSVYCPDLKECRCEQFGRCQAI